MTLKSEQELEALRRIGQIVAQVLQQMLDAAEPGVTTAELDALGARLLAEHGALSAPMHSVGFPATTCISVNEEVAHGIPGPRVLQSGDLVNIDVSASLDGFFADTGASKPLGPSEHLDLQRRLCDATQEALNAALAVVTHGAPFRAMGRAIEEVAKKRGFRVIRNLCSHGVGRSLHEPPDYIPGFEDRHDKRTFKDGDVITIEPFLTTGRSIVHEGSDRWTLLNTKGSFSAQYEHSLIITRDAPILLTVA
jgi:methionyl aminopeptidase